MKYWKKEEIAVKKKMELKKLLKKASQSCTSVEDLLDLVSMSTFDDIIKSLNADKWVIKFKTKTIFKLILYSIVESDRLSLRVMSEHSEDPLFQAMSEQEEGVPISYTTIRNRLNSIKPEFFEKSYAATLQKLRTQYSTAQQNEYNIKRYDSTMIHTFSHLLSGMKVGNTSKNKTQTKLVTELTNDFEVRMDFFKDQAHLSEETALAESIQSVMHSKNDLIVFDRGLKSRKTFVGFDDKSLNFVTRLSDNANYQLIEMHSEVAHIEDDKLIFLQDSVVYLYGDGKKLVEHPFRLIEMERKTDKKKIILLTNMGDKLDQVKAKIVENDSNSADPVNFNHIESIAMSTQEIALIYKKRWDIEVLFRFLKQEMNLTHYVCNEPAAIKAMVYCTLIVGMLILIYKKTNNMPSYKIAKMKFAQELKTDILLEILEDPAKNAAFLRLLKKNRERKEAQKIKNLAKKERIPRKMSSIK